MTTEVPFCLEVTESLSDATFVGRSAKSLSVATQFDGYTKVVLVVSEELEYIAGTDTGRTLTVECPWGSQQICDDILTQIHGYAYQPFDCSGAILDPAAELGDAVTVGDTYGAFFSAVNHFGYSFQADISAPHEEEIDHEYPYKSPESRKVERRFANVAAELRIQADLIAAEVEERLENMEAFSAALQVQSREISAKVSRTGGSAASFGWDLTDTDWTIQANGRAVLKATSAGLEVYGKITAEEGRIGGFDIMANYLSYNNQTWGGTNRTGIYIGPEGLQLGKNFYVDNNGNLYAYSGTFDGTIYAGNIVEGGENNKMDGSLLYSHTVDSSRLVYNTISTSYTSGGINTSLGYADFANLVFQGVNTPSRMIVKSLTASNYFYIGNTQLKYHSTQVMTGPDTYTTIGYWGS